MVSTRSRTAAAAAGAAGRSPRPPAPQPDLTVDIRPREVIHNGLIERSENEDAPTPRFLPLAQPPPRRPATAAAAGPSHGGRESLPAPGVTVRSRPGTAGASAAPASGSGAPRVSPPPLGAAASPRARAPALHLGANPFLAAGEPRKVRGGRDKTGAGTRTEAEEEEKLAEILGPLRTAAIRDLETTEWMFSAPRHAPPPPYGR
jgi:hypothetical protein